MGANSNGPGSETVVADSPRQGPSHEHACLTSDQILLRYNAGLRVTKLMSMIFYFTPNAIIVISITLNLF